MAKAPPSAKRDRIKAFTPALVDYTNEVVYGHLWERKALSKRDRSLITVAALVATYRPQQCRICRARLRMASRSKRSPKSSPTWRSMQAGLQRCRPRRLPTRCSSKATRGHDNGQ
jgi:hypothetical protein